MGKTSLQPEYHRTNQTKLSVFLLILETNTINYYCYWSLLYLGRKRIGFVVFFRWRRGWKACFHSTCFICFTIIRRKCLGWIFTILKRFFLTSSVSIFATWVFALHAIITVLSLYAVFFSIHWIRSSSANEEYSLTRAKP